METEQDVPRKESQSSLLAKIREPIYQGSARWARPHLSVIAMKEEIPFF